MNYIKPDRNPTIPKIRELAPLIGTTRTERLWLQSTRERMRHPQ
jgi:hypothetical protein